LDDVEDSDVVFSAFLVEFGSEVCPVGGVIIYEDRHWSVVCIWMNLIRKRIPLKDDGGIPFFVRGLTFFRKIEWW
jgi:hypothetical protein